MATGAASLPLEILEAFGGLRSLRFSQVTGYQRWQRDVTCGEALDIQRSTEP